MTDNTGPLQEPGGLADSDSEQSFQRLVLESRDVRDFLAELAVRAASRLSVRGNTIHSGVTVIRRRKPQAVAASEAAARVLDELQNGFGDGPCLTALRKRTTLLVPDLAAEKRWEPYVRAALEHGVSSILAIPLDLSGDAEAVLNLYSGCSNGFSAEDISTAEAFARQAAGSIRLILRITQLNEAREDMSAAMQSRTVIDMAIGAIMAENRCTRDEAFNILTRASSTRNIKLRDVAASVITSISGEEKIPTHFSE
ncbi:GAF and ANTAR domain-containing protein [Arthrobacter sp. SLBN-122]|uniref:GAF and ANTAR domain-containing protein n=1 Tax=Arthrobacter sp. SLBN-122 TaxID=2768455 RepID=UPI001150309D|nr:GAF and ANTAR domain-containing protein [Arthrobacter sp. SLBN-122]TQJ33962.1 GAF domain-containing protein [Arthrobacter sp. SLBN-122]